MAKESDLPHRDDLPMDVVRHMEEAIKKRHGDDFKIVFGGDTSPKHQEEALKSFALLEARADETFFTGRCFTCGTAMTDEERKKFLASIDDDASDKADLPEGWEWEELGESFTLHCPVCEENEGITPLAEL